MNRVSSEITIDDLAIGCQNKDFFGFLLLLRHILRTVTYLVNFGGALNTVTSLTDYSGDFHAVSKDIKN